MNTLHVLAAAVLSSCLCAAALAQPAGAPGQPSGYGRSPEEAQFAMLADEYLSRFKPLYEESSKAWWQANTTGSDAAFARKEKADKALVELHSDSAVFARLKQFKEAGTIKDPVLARELDVIYRTYLPNQADAKLLERVVAIQNDVEKTFNTYRAEIDGNKLSSNDLQEILRTSKDSGEVKAAWTGFMDVGRKVESQLREVVKLRNQIARGLGYKNFHAMQLAVTEIDEKQLFGLFDELDDLTRAPFAAVKKDIDAQMAARFGVEESQLRPWHYGDFFFQEAPVLGEVNLDAVFADADLVALVKKYYTSLGMPCEDIIARSDLYEKEGKSPHAFSTDLDREGDIRVLCNLEPNVQWADTIMHEVGHAVYDKYIRQDVPYLLHEASHSITTEGMAMMFGALAKNEEWLVKVRGLDPTEAAKVVTAAKEALRVEKLLFSRWSQVMVRFEYEMYNNPDQDLSKLWWNLKKKYQLMNPPDDAGLPGYAAKVHVLTVPVYYHSYLMGDVFAAQVRNYMARKVMGLSDPYQTSFFGNAKAGKFLRDEIFGPGNLYSWSDLTQRATGEPLTAKYFAEMYLR